MSDPNVMAEWEYDAQLIVDYEPKATVWDLFKFEYMKLYGSLPPNVDQDYPDERLLRLLSRWGWSPQMVADFLGFDRWLVVEALDFFGIEYCQAPVDANGILVAHNSGERDRQVLAKRFRTTLYYVDKVLRMNGLRKCQQQT